MRVPRRGTTGSGSSSSVDEESLGITSSFCATIVTDSALSSSSDDKLIARTLGWDKNVLGFSP